MLKRVLSIKCFLIICCICQHLAKAIPYRSRYYGMRCTDKDTRRELYVGETFTRPGLCIRVQCLGSLQLWEDSCQVPQLEGECLRIPPANEFLDYPQCCPLYQCKKYTKNRTGQSEETRMYDHYGTLLKTSITQIFEIRDLLTGRGAGEPPKTQFEI